MSPACTSTQVYRPKGPELFHFPHCGRRRTKWGRGTVGIERPDTTACRPWAMKRHSQNYSLLGHFLRHTVLKPTHTRNRNLREDSSWKYSTATRKTVQE